MYRILIARNGYYYVQKEKFTGWMKVGGFFRTRKGAERFISYDRGLYVPSNRVVGYY